MNDIIPIKKVNGIKTADSRDLHKFLEVKTPHHKWIKRKLDDLGMVEGVDYLTDKIVRQLASGAKHLTEYHLTQNAAEHIGMAESTEIGKQIREAFIAARDEARKLRRNPRQQLYGEHTERSILMRKLECKEWSRLGATGQDFGSLTRKEYDLLGFDRDTTKKTMDEDEILLLIASNALNVRACKQVDNRVHKKGIEAIMEKTARGIAQATRKEIVA
jgi:phage anti-repressor protein